MYYIAILHATLSVRFIKHKTFANKSAIYLLKKTWWSVSQWFVSHY